MKKYRFELILFIIEAICMILELIASRLLSPYFGSSNFVWTSIIGIILLSSSIGNYCGGFFADKNSSSKFLKFILIVISIYIFIIPILNSSILEFITKNINDIRVGSIVATILLFFIPSLLMGIISPIIVKTKMDNIETAGSISGRMSAIGTLGGIFGTFIGGFYLIPIFGSLELLFILIIVVLLLIPLVDLKLKSKTNIFVIIMILISSLLFYKYSYDNRSVSSLVLDGVYNKVYKFDTEYGSGSIYNDSYFVNNKYRNVRILEFDSGFESVAYIDDELKYELYPNYTKLFDLVFKSKHDINDILMIGGAGYSYPKYYISHYLDKSMDVLEIDGEMTEIAKKYFYLDDLINDYNLNKNKRLNIYNLDGRVYLNKNKKKYDAIMNDAFDGISPPASLVTLEAIKMIKKSLNDGGVYLTNVIGSVDGNNSGFVKVEVNTIKQVFKYVYVVPFQNNFGKDEVINFMVIACDENIDLDNVYDLEISKDEIIFTDNYCPVDKCAIYNL